MTQDNPSSSSTTQNPVTLTVRVEHVRDTFGIGTDRPRLSWIVDGEKLKVGIRQATRSQNMIQRAV